MLEEINKIYDDMGIDNDTLNLVYAGEKEILDQFNYYEKIANYNQLKVLNAFQENNISLRHFAPSSGYGYEDESKLALDRVYAKVFGCDDAIVRPQIVSGTHCISIALFGMLRPKDTMVCITGTPYDTLQKTIGIKEASGSLKEWGVNYKQIELIENKNIDIQAVLKLLKEDKTVKMIYIQRSRGYANRKTMSISDMEFAVKEIRKVDKDVIIFADNCYGEFTETKEPTNVGVDVVAGSLIKNPGGGIAPTGGYIAGRKDLIEKIADRFTAPGLSKDTCSYNASYTNFFQGFFLAPHVVLQSIKGSILMAKVFENLGYEVSPRCDETRSDLIQSIIFNNEKDMINFCKGIQKSAPVDSYAVPEPWDMPGYSDKIIMAAGAFIQGSSIEFSADGPIKPPYTAFAQGGLTYEHIKIGVMFAIMALKN